MSEVQVEAPQVESPAAEKKPAPAKKPAPKKNHTFDLDDETVHQKYFIPPAGYRKPQFPTPQ